MDQKLKRVVPRANGERREGRTKEKSVWLGARGFGLRVRELGGSGLLFLYRRVVKPVRREKTDWTDRESGKKRAMDQGWTACVDGGGGYCCY